MQELACERLHFADASRAAIWNDKLVNCLQ